VKGEPFRERETKIIHERTGRIPRAERGERSKQIGLEIEAVSGVNQSCCLCLLFQFQFQDLKIDDRFKMG
jgi:hypothetical protein